jgi:DNA mismatch repair protein MutL
MPAPAAATAPNRPIRRLDPLLVNQIAAGEVVDRPASVVKELVENALDAGATRIAIDIERGGIELIRVSDNGCGMAPDQLPLAITPHATSKVATPEDLEAIATMGFRGEALASIASVSRFSIRSRSGACEAASIIEIAGADQSPVQPASGAIGTVVSVRNLFFNTPARRKFLRTPQTEQNRCADVVRSLAAANPSIAFTLSCDGKSLVDLPANQSPRNRGLAILGKELESQLIEVHADSFDDARGIALWGLVGLPAIARGSNKSQHVFLNGRPVRDKTIAHAIKESYRGLMEHTRHATALLMIEMDPSAIDVNVHPAKAEVRFRDSSLVHSVVLRAIREALRGADLTPGVGADGGGPIDREGLGPASDHPGAAQFRDYFTRQVPAMTGGKLNYEALRDALERPTDPPSEPPAQAGGPAPSPEDASSPDQTGHPLGVPLPANPVLQVHKSYLVTQDQEGVVIIDQHALHERAMFELLLARIDQGNLESQRLLTPAVVQVSSGQMEKLSVLNALFARVGVEAEPIGPSSIAVHAFPTFLFDKGVEPEPFVREIFEKAEAGGFSPTSEEALHTVLDMMSCKAAIKAGDAMSSDELAALVRIREQIERSSSCPHGRPTSVRLTIRQLERLFHRT